ncbi:hypothetical protein HF086_009942 [Spodoptera exigua]|uniref:PiggyBac transposable element-derived protein domain-containing protein n=1 Tax=Spodoptera exigua TaxID=7107 RepID=A0A922M460_SPOEX|nr:hypothetical protein HF086_009942 [Spodoptera exigua]
MPGIYACDLQRMASDCSIMISIDVDPALEPRHSPPVEPYFRVPQVSALSVTQLPAPSFTQIKPSTVAFLDINSNGSTSNCASPSTCRPSDHQLKDERPCRQNYGKAYISRSRSEEESDEAPPATGDQTPKHLYGISEDSTTMEEFSIVYDWVPPSPVAQQPTPEPTPAPVSRGGSTKRKRETARHVKQFLPKDLFQFSWKPLSQSSSSNTRRESFSQVNVGPTTTYDSTYDAFVAIWDREFMESIAAETNRYAEQMMRRMADEGTLSLRSRILFWKETNPDELYVFFAIILAMGIVVKAHVEEYWSTAKDIFSTPSFSTTMAYSRFLLLNRCIHFMDNETCDPINMTPPQAKLLKVQILVDHLNKRFSELYTLQQNIVIDNFMTQSKRHPYLKEKDHIVSGETYEVCECQTGYLWRFDVRTEYDTSSPEAQSSSCGLIPTVVLKLLDGLEYKGYTVWMDKNSPSLARILKSKGFDCVGKLKTGDQYVPGEIAALQKGGVAFGQISGYTSGDVDLIVIGDQKRIAMVSTYHGTGTVINRNNDKVKSSIIYDYNICMGGINKKDQIDATCPEEKRSQIWYKKIFKRLLNLSVLNAFIMYKHGHEKETQRGFRMNLINSLLKQHQQWNAVIPTPVVFPSDEFIHYAVENRFLPSAKQRMRRHCAHCSKRCTSSCFGCKVPLCVFTCFHPFHTRDPNGTGDPETVA